MKPITLPVAALLCSLSLFLTTIYSKAAVPGLAQQIPASEYAALVNLYTVTQDQYSSARWTHSDGWTDPTAPIWFGVTVSGFEYDSATGEVLKVGHVSEIALAHNNLINTQSGSIPDSIGDLAYLTSLDLSSNVIFGSIPDSIGRLVKLKRLQLGGDWLGGDIPESLGNLVDLQVLDLAWNDGFTGNIPQSIGNLTNLRELYLDHNRLDGSIPESMGNLVNLQTLDLSYNHGLGGSIPESLGNLANLQRLGLADNKFSGSVPESFVNLVNLQALDLGYNRLSGRIPEGLADLANLFAFVIQLNCFDLTLGSEARTVVDRMIAAGKSVVYTLDTCGQPSDLNNDGCVDRSDLAALLTAIRARSSDLTYDLNGDGKVDIADARFLVLHFSNRDGSPCASPANAKIVEHLQSQTSSHNLK